MHKHVSVLIEIYCLLGLFAAAIECCSASGWEILKEILHASDTELAGKLFCVLWRGNLCFRIKHYANDNAKRKFTNIEEE